ncbi:hypothetical protein PSHT_05003, partial [Puccinia striiformis]
MGIQPYKNVNLEPCFCFRIPNQIKMSTQVNESVPAKRTALSDSAAKPTRKRSAKTPISPAEVPSEWEREAEEAQTDNSIQANKKKIHQPKDLTKSDPVDKPTKTTEYRKRAINSINSIKIPLKSKSQSQPSILSGTDLANAARALPDPETIRIKIVEKPTNKPIASSSKTTIDHKPWDPSLELKMTTRRGLTLMEKRGEISSQEMLQLRDGISPNQPEVANHPNNSEPIIPESNEENMEVETQPLPTPALPPPPVAQPVQLTRPSLPSRPSTAPRARTEASRPHNQHRQGSPPNPRNVRRRNQRNNPQPPPRAHPYQQTARMNRRHNFQASIHQEIIRLAALSKGPIRSGANEIPKPRRRDSSPTPRGKRISSKLTRDELVTLLQELFTSIEKIVDTNASDLSKQINLRSNTESSSCNDSEMKSLISENLCYLKDNIVKTDLIQSDQKLNEMILILFDNLFSLVYDKLDNFSKIMYHSFTDNANKIESFSQSNLLSASSLSTDMRQIKTMIENNEREPVSNSNSREKSQSQQPMSYFQSDQKEGSTSCTNLPEQDNSKGKSREVESPLHPKHDSGRSTNSKQKEGSSKLKCYTCNQPGHSSRNCPKSSRKISQLEGESDSEMSTQVNESVPAKRTALSDSAAKPTRKRSAKTPISPAEVPSEWEREAEEAQTDNSIQANKKKIHQPKDLTKSDPVDKPTKTTEYRKRAINSINSIKIPLKSKSQSQPSILSGTDLANAARALPDPETIRIKIVEKPTNKPIASSSKTTIDHKPWDPSLELKMTTRRGLTLMEKREKSHPRDAATTRRNLSESTRGCESPEQLGADNTGIERGEHGSGDSTTPNSGLATSSCSPTGAANQTFTSLPTFDSSTSSDRSVETSQSAPAGISSEPKKREAKKPEEQPSTSPSSSSLPTDRQDESTAQLPSLDPPRDHPIGPHSPRDLSGVGGDEIPKPRRRDSSPTPRGKRISSKLTRDELVTLLQELFTSIEKIVDTNASDLSKQINLRSNTELKNIIGQRSDSIDTKLKSLQFTSENTISVLNKTPLNTILNTLTNFSRSSSCNDSEMKSLISENLCYLKDNIVKTDLIQSDQKLNEMILSNNKLHSSFDNLFSLVYDKLDNFSKIMYRSFTDNANKIESFSQSNLLSALSLSTDMRQIKTMIENNEREPVSNSNSKEKSRSDCHNNLNDPNNEITGAVLTIGNDQSVCHCHDKILELKLDHELLTELNDKIENLIDSTVEPIKDVQQRLLIIENNQNRQFQSLADKIDLLLNIKSESQQPMSYFQSDQKEGSTSCTNLPEQDNSKGKSREVESPLHPKHDSGRSTSLYPVTSKEALDNFTLNKKKEALMSTQVNESVPAKRTALSDSAAKPTRNAQLRLLSVQQKSPPTEEAQTDNSIQANKKKIHQPKDLTKSDPVDKPTKTTEYRKRAINSINSIKIPLKSKSQSQPSILSGTDLANAARALPIPKQSGSRSDLRPVDPSLELKMTTRRGLTLMEKREKSHPRECCNYETESLRINQRLRITRTTRSDNTGIERGEHGSETQPLPTPALPPPPVAQPTFTSLPTFDSSTSSDRSVETSQSAPAGISSEPKKREAKKPEEQPSTSPSSSSLPTDRQDESTAQLPSLDPPRDHPIGRTLQGTYQELEAMRYRNRDGEIHPNTRGKRISSKLTRDELVTSYKSFLPPSKKSLTLTPLISKQINLRSNTELKNIIGQRSDSIDTKLKSLQFTSSITINYIPFDNLFSLVYDKLDNFSKIMYRSFTDNANKIESFSQSNLLSASSLSTDMRQIKTMIKNNEREPVSNSNSREKSHLLLNIKSESQQPMSYFQSDQKEGSTSCTNLPEQDNSKGKSREVESPLHPKRDSGRSTSLYPVTSKEALDNFLKCYTCNQPGHSSRNCPKSSRKISQLEGESDSE